MTSSDDDTVSCSVSTTSAITGTYGVTDGTFSYAPAEGDEALSPITFTATATGNGGSAAKSFVVAVAAASDSSAPVVSAIDNQAVLACRTLVVPFVVSEADGDAVTTNVTATTIGVTGQYGLDANGIFTYTPSLIDVALSPVKFTVSSTDKDGTDSKSFDVVVTIGAAPQISAVDDGSVFSGNTFTHTIAITATDGDEVTSTNVTVKADTEAPAGEWNFANGVFTFTPAASDINKTFSFTVSATDFDGTATCDFSVTVDEIADFMETFSGATKGEWATGAISKTDHDSYWYGTNVMMNTASQAELDAKSVKTRNDACLYMTRSKSKGVSKIAINIGTFKRAAVGDKTYQLFVSNDEGETWKAVTEELSVPQEFTKVVFDGIDIPGNVRLKIEFSNSTYCSLNNILMWDYIVADITVEPSLLEGFVAYNVDGMVEPSSPKSVSIVGLEMTQPLVITAPAGYEIATLDDLEYSSSKTISEFDDEGQIETNVLVRLIGTVVGSCSGELSVASGSISNSVGLVGSVKSSHEPSVTLSFASSSVEVGAPLTITLIGSDVDGDELTYGVIAPEGFAEECAIADNVVTWTPSSEGTREISFALSDGESIVTRSATFTALPRTVRNVAGGKAGAYVETFDAMGTSATAALPDGWCVFSDPLVRSFANGKRATDVAKLNQSVTGFENFWCSTNSEDRALGFITGGGNSSLLNSTQIMLALRVRNASAVKFRGFNVSYSIEKYRNGSRDWRARLYYSTDGKTWMNADEEGNEVFGRAFAGDGEYAVPASYPVDPVTKVSGTLAKKVASGDEIYFGWFFSGATAAGGMGLGIDDVCIEPILDPTTIVVLQ